VLAVRLRETVLQHAIVVPHHRRQLGVKIEQGVCEKTEKRKKKNKKKVSQQPYHQPSITTRSHAPCLLIVSPYVRASLGRSVPMLSYNS